MTGPYGHVVAGGVNVVTTEIVQISNPEVGGGALDVPHTVEEITPATIDQQADRIPVGAPLRKKPGGIDIIAMTIAENPDSAGPTVTVEIISPLAESHPLDQ
jgi:hypothetical protein